MIQNIYPTPLYKTAQQHRIYVAIGMYSLIDPWDRYVVKTHPRNVKLLRLPYWNLLRRHGTITASFFQRTYPLDHGLCFSNPLECLILISLETDKQ